MLPTGKLLASSIASCSISCAATLPAVPPLNATSGCFCQEWSSLGSWPRDETQDGKGSQAWKSSAVMIVRHEIGQLYPCYHRVRQGECNSVTGRAGR